jgi:hypothetical protein
MLSHSQWMKQIYSYCIRKLFILHEKIAGIIFCCVSRDAGHELSCWPEGWTGLRRFYFRSAAPVKKAVTQGNPQKIMKLVIRWNISQTTHCTSSCNNETACGHQNINQSNIFIPRICLVNLQSHIL